MLREIRKKIRKIFDSFYCVKITDKVEFGKESSWHVWVKNFDKNTIVYSGGVGRDISFELDLVHCFNCQIYLYDPSITAFNTMNALLDLPKSIHFNKVGFSRNNEIVKFAYPDNLEEGSFKKIVNENIETKYVEYHCNSLKNLMEINQHTKIDLLKIDIEGFEYEVLEDIVNEKIIIEQICVEFHHFLPGIPRSRTSRIIRTLKNAGYRLIHKKMTDYTFVLENRLF